MINEESTPDDTEECNVGTSSKTPDEKSVLTDTGGFNTSSSETFKEAMERLGVEEKRSVLKWRKTFSIFMLFFISVQYIVLVHFIISQGVGIFWVPLVSTPFQIDKTIFYILTGGTLAQSYFLIRIIFQHVFRVTK